MILQQKANIIHYKQYLEPKKQNLMSFFLLFTLSQPRMEWTRAKDVMLTKEVLYLEPFQFKERTSQSVQAWQEVTNKLVTNYPGDFGRLTSRGAKDHVGLLIRNQKKKDAAELRASGVSPVHTELDDLLQEIIEKMELHASKNDKENEIKKREEAVAKDVRLKAMEALSQTKKREEIEGNESKPAKQRKRSNGSEMLAYMRERADEELALRAKAEETKQIQMDKEAKRQEDLLKILAGQQNQQQEFQQQQLQLHQEAMKQQQQQFLQMQQMMANQQQQNFQMLMAILQKKN